MIDRRSFFIGVFLLSCSSSLVCFTDTSFAQDLESSGHGAGPRFVGNLVIEDINDPSGRLFRLTKPFGYIDSKDIEWRAEAGAEIDGASIPRIFWPVIGSPYVGLYRRASVIHDFYIKHKFRRWQDVHRVFYDAMITAGVKKTKALFMFGAVWLFGPRWDVKAPTCPPGWMCALRPVWFVTQYDLDLGNKSIDEYLDEITELENLSKDPGTTIEDIIELSGSIKGIRRTEETTAVPMRSPEGMKIGAQYFKVRQNRN